MTTPAPDLRSALVVGLLDAAGFVLGALAGWQLGRWLGVDLMATPGFGGDAMIALLPILAGLGLGRWASRAIARRVLRATPPTTSRPGR